MVVGVTSSRSAAKTEQSKTRVKPKKKEEENFIKKGGCIRIKKWVDAIASKLKNHSEMP